MGGEQFCDPALPRLLAGEREELMSPFQNVCHQRCQIWINTEMEAWLSSSLHMKGRFFGGGSA